MKKFLVVTSLLHMTAICLCAPSKETQKNSNTTYDQRQVGKYNIHVNIKDVSVHHCTELRRYRRSYRDSYSDYYDYEDSEYTVNPITADLSGKPTTAKPNVSNPLLPSIAGLNLTSISTSTASSASAVTLPQTLVVIHEKPTASSNETDKLVESASVSYQPDEIPVRVIVEPLLKPKVRPSLQPSLQPVKRKLSNRQVSEKTDADDYEVRPRRRRGQIMERVRSRRAQNRLSRNGGGCGRGRTSDGEGGCRVRRSGMSGFLEMLTRFLPQGSSE